MTRTIKDIANRYHEDLALALVAARRDLAQCNRKEQRIQDMIDRHVAYMQDLDKVLTHVGVTTNPSDLLQDEEGDVWTHTIRWVRSLGEPFSRLGNEAAIAIHQLKRLYEAQLNEHARHTHLELLVQRTGDAVRMFEDMERGESHEQ